MSAQNVSFLFQVEETVGLHHGVQKRKGLALALITLINNRHIVLF